MRELRGAVVQEDAVRRSYVVRIAVFSPAPDTVQQIRALALDLGWKVHGDVAPTLLFDTRPTSDRDAAEALAALINALPFVGNAVVAPEWVEEAAL